MKAALNQPEAGEKDEPVSGVTGTRTFSERSANFPLHE